MHSTLVIHPLDITTEDLCPIYENKDWDIIRNPPYNNLKEEIEKHSRIILLGHGTSEGLIAPEIGYIIDKSYLPLLQKKETISVWCNSNQFFKGLPGFHTGMIVSEDYEAEQVGCYKLIEGETEDEFQKRIRQNLNWLAHLIGECIDFPLDEMKNYLLEKYYKEGDSIIEFNRLGLNPYM